MNIETTLLISLSVWEGEKYIRRLLECFIAKARGRLAAGEAVELRSAPFALTQSIW